MNNKENINKLHCSKKNNTYHNYLKSQNQKKDEKVNISKNNILKKEVLYHAGKLIGYVSSYNTFYRLLDPFDLISLKKELKNIINHNKIDIIKYDTYSSSLINKFDTSDIINMYPVKMIMTNKCRISPEVEKIAKACDVKIVYF